MLTKYIEAAMRRAQYQWVAEDEVYFGKAPDLPGAWASGKTEAECAEQLREVVEDWVLLGLRFGDEFPVIDGIALKYKDVA